MTDGMVYSGACTLKVDAKNEADMYIPHGEGLMTMTDGSQYMGEFFRGKAQGNGTFNNTNGA